MYKLTVLDPDYCHPIFSHRKHDKKFYAADDADDNDEQVKLLHRFC